MFSPKPVFVTQGGGVTKHYDCEAYIDLIMHDFQVDQDLHDSFTELFEKFAFHEPYEKGVSHEIKNIASFGYCEITRDPRLKKSLSKTTEGKALFRRLLQEAPVITFSNKILGDAENTEAVKIFPLSDLGDSPKSVMDEIYRRIGEANKKANEHNLKKISQLNNILQLKPSLFGLGLNVNNLIDDWVASKRSSK